MRATPDVELSIVMPCLNEAETIETCVRKALHFLSVESVRGEVVVGDNGSTDGSPEFARRAGARVVSVAHRGYGAALYHATLAAHGKYVIMGDADDSYDFTALMPFLVRLREGYDLVVGNRFMGGIDAGAMPFKNRRIGNPVLTGIGRVLFHSPVGDFHCGLRGYSAAAFERLDMRATGMEFASEMIIKSTLRGLRICEVPTTLKKDGRSRPPHLRPWRDGWRHLRFMLLFSPRWLFLYPGLAMVALGLVVGGALMAGPIWIGRIGLDVGTMVYAMALVLLGSHMASFAFLSKVYAVQEGLLPGDPTLTRLFRYLTLEVGLLVGFGLMTAGFGGGVYAVGRWSARGFGPLDPQQALRIVIPSCLALALGWQVVLTSFFFSILGLKIRKAAT